MLGTCEVVWQRAGVFDGPSGVVTIEGKLFIFLITMICARTISKYYEFLNRMSCMGSQFLSKFSSKGSG